MKTATLLEWIFLPRPVGSTSSSKAAFCSRIFRCLRKMIDMAQVKNSVLITLTVKCL